jgi:hypothetical protein
MPPRNYERDPSESKMLVKDLNVVHSSWVLKKKRKKMQGERELSLLPDRGVEQDS